MITETRALDNINFSLPQELSPEETVYFDIETTGFSADVTALYLIGCIYYEYGHWQLIQWFAEDTPSETAALAAFAEFIKDKKNLICYNGTTFDLPYLRKKYNKYGLKFNTDKFEIIDFYRVFSPFKNFLGLTGLKQKDMEAYLGIGRDDTFSGGELIEWYSKYLRLRFSESAEKDEIYRTLLLHNSDDLVGLARLTALYGFLHYITGLTKSENVISIEAKIENVYKANNKVSIDSVVKTSNESNIEINNKVYSEVKPAANTSANSKISIEVKYGYGIKTGNEIETGTKISENIIDTDKKQLVLSTTVDFDCAKEMHCQPEINFEKNDFSCRISYENTMKKPVITLGLSLTDAELKLFYKDYKNYYYLPKEDMVIHKNLAAFVDKENKEKAVAANCYTRHNGIFLRIPEELDIPVFKRDYSDKALYTLLDDKLLNSDRNLNIIFKSVLSFLIR